MIKSKGVRLAAVLLLAAATGPLAACATASKPAAMTLSAGSAGAVPAVSGDPGYHALRVAKVEGGSETNPMWMSSISSTDFEKALTDSLKNLDYLAADGSGYEVMALIESIDRPMAGLDMSVTLKVRYTVRPTGGAPVFNEVVAATGTAKLSDAFMGVERLRLANEAATRENIAEFTRRLKATWK